MTVLRRRRALMAMAGLPLVLAGCVPSQRETRPAAPPDTREPEIRVGLEVGTDQVRVGGGAALELAAPDGSLVATIRAGEVVRVRPAPAGLEFADWATGRATVAEQLVVRPATPGDPVRIGGKDYRGTVALLRDRQGVTVVNRLGLENYLLGVIGAEMGRRPRTDAEALRAQAIVSRTYAVRNLDRWAAQGFDLYATVADQVYGGIEAEYPLAREAVAATRGLVLTFGGEPIDAFFYSTCGGRTAEGTEVFRAARRPYLQSVSDLAPNGEAYCRFSPRYRWTEQWTGEALRATLQRYLPDAPPTVRQVRSVRVTRRTGSGRAGELTVALRDIELFIDGPEIRRVLRTPSGGLLRSNAFTLEEERSGGQVIRLTATGAGAGHGVGMCQWGAVGRSRAGQHYDEILYAYFPGTTLERLY